MGEFDWLKQMSAGEFHSGEKILDCGISPAMDKAEIKTEPGKVSFWI